VLEEKRILEETKRELLGEIGELRRRVVGWKEGERRIRGLEEMVEEKAREVEGLRAEVEGWKGKSVGLSATIKQQEKQLALL